ncbi:GNAT family N-acetyltransferase [Mesobacillus maritimus]|nr:GNAT family N-acetyltransferase [Mesobacillus maritimus]MCM3667852.1 GNAT family N-acetyltransferase [Mesobacillus maritimus]
MNSSEFEQYLSHAIRGYADEHVKAGNWNEQEALSKATKEYERLLPDGEKTANHTLFTIRDEDKEVGMIWLAQRANDKGFIYDINIWEENQGRGYGKQAMIEIEKVARKLGLKSIKLHVFGHNRVARGLYEKLGYLETSIVMEKKI